MVLNAKESFPWLQDALPTGGTSNVQQCFLHYKSQNLSINTSHTTTQNARKPMVAPIFSGTTYSAPCLMPV